MVRDRKAEFRDTRWSSRRVEFIEQNERRCQSCEEQGPEVKEVHISFYEEDKALWDFDDKYLVALCGRCLQRRKELERDVRSFFGQITNEELDALADALSAFIQITNGRSALFHKLRDQANSMHHAEEF